MTKLKLNGNGEVILARKLPKARSLTPQEVVVVKEEPTLKVEEKQSKKEEAKPRKKKYLDEKV